MNLALIIGVGVLIAIGVVFGVMQLGENDDESIVIEEFNDEPKEFTVGLSESMGVTIGKP